MKILFTYYYPQRGREKQTKKEVKTDRGKEVRTDGGKEGGEDIMEGRKEVKTDGGKGGEDIEYLTLTH